MRKITLMCSLFFTASLTAFAEVGDKITSLDQLSNDKVYTVTPQDGKRGTWCYDENNPDVLTSTTRTEDEINMNDVNQQFAFLKSESGRLFVYSIGAQKFFSKGSGVVSLVSEISNENVLSSILNSTNSDKANYPWVVAVNGSQLNLCNPGSSDPSGVALYNNLSDGGNSICITEAGNFEQNENVMKYIQQVDKKFEVVEEANAYLKVPANSVGGYSETLWNALYEACGSDGSVEISDTNHPNFETALNNIKAGTPINFSNDKVYKIQNYIASNGYLISREQTDNSQVFSSAKKGEQTEALPIIANSEKWQAYIDDAGNTLLYNQGTQKYVQYDAVNNLWKLTEEAAYCNIQKNEAKGMGAYSIQDPNYTDHRQYMHVNNGQKDISGVKGWETSADATNFYFIETEGTAVDLASIALDKVKSEAQKLIDSYSAAYSDYIGCYSSASIAALKTAIQAPDATVSSIQNAIGQTKASAKTIQADKYYRIQNTMAFDDGETKFIYESADGSNIAWGSGTQSPAELWKLVATDEGTYYITSANTGKQIQLNPGMTGYLTEESTTPFTLESKDNSYTYGLVAYSQNDHATLVLQKKDGWGQTATSADLSGNYVGTYKDFSAKFPTKWNIIETRSAKLEIGETGYATVWFPYAVTIPPGVEAYYISSAQNGIAVLTQVNGVIPAESGVILKGAQGTYEFVITDDQTPAITGNNLSGTSIATTIENEVNAYVLAQPAGKEIGFYLLESGEEADRTIGANKAYLTVTAPAGIKAFTFDFGGTTGIENTESVTEAEEYYDLQGRRVMNPTKGIYVTKSGKKVLFTK